MLISIQLEYVVGIIIIMVVTVGLCFSIYYTKLENLKSDHNILSEHVQSEISNIFNIMIENRKNNVVTLDNYKQNTETQIFQNLLQIEDNNKIIIEKSINLNQRIS